MELVDQSYDILNRMLNDKTLTDKDKIFALKSFINDVENYLLFITLSSDDLKACNELLKVYEDKLKELQGI
jgi:hypothetical protein